MLKIRMGGTNSRQLSKRSSKRKRKERRKREQSQWSGQQQMLPMAHSPASYSNSDPRHFGYDDHEAMNFMNNQTSDQFLDNLWNTENSNNINVPSDFCFVSMNEFDQPNNYPVEDFVEDFDVSFENTGSCLQRSSSANKYEERKFRRPIRRHHSFNENRFLFQSGQSTMIDSYSTEIRCNSLMDLNKRCFLFDGQYIGNSFTNFSSLNLHIQNRPFDRFSSHSSSTYGAQGWLGGGGIKRSSHSDYSDDVSWDENSKGACKELLLFDSPDKPRIKRRQSDDNESIDSLSADYRNENERCDSDQSFYSNTTNYSTDDNARSSTTEACGGLDILSFPSEWSSFAVNKTGYVNIPFSSPEGKSVKKFFERTCRSKDSYLAISGIIRVENPFLHTLYLLKKEEMALSNGHVDELFLYHGTKKRLVSNICENNLDWRQHSEMHRFGKGVSFSPYATYSSHYSDDRGSDKIIMLFKVLVSKSVLGLPEMDIPLDDEGVSYDASIKEDTSVIVKYYDNEFYPLYKILYNKI